MNDFSKQTLRKLAKKGIYLIGLQAIPNMSSPMPYANAERGYYLNNNGQGQIRTFAEVLELAK